MNREELFLMSILIRVPSKLKNENKNSNNRSKCKFYDSAFITVDNNLFCHSSEGSIYGEISSDQTLDP